MTLLKMNARGTLTVPKALRRGLPKEMIFEAIRREDGVIELRPRTTVDASQRWFWSERWQRMEREADADIAAGRVLRFDNAEGFLTDLDAE
jgi:bifunctional DNA-binding transcriptional regulator/antitoxin component of YhaV-PrlF toxin-antitoxin module